MANCCLEGHINVPSRTWCAECRSLLVGTVIDDYTIISYLGQGSTSTVYLASQHSLNGRKVVIKVLRSSWSQGHTDVFRREAELLAALSHPYILPIYAYGVIEEQGATSVSHTPYLVLPYVERGSLEDLFIHEGKRPWPLNRIISLAEEVADALEYAHSRGVLHRDIKPANLLLMGSHVVLSDFGVASWIGAEISHLNAPWAGSPAYMAPEVWGMRPGRYSDQYALAVTCFRLLTGTYPWEPGESTRQWSHLHCTVVPRSLQECRSDLPGLVNVVLQQALAKDPHKRYPTVKAFASDLRTAAQESTRPLDNPPVPVPSVQVRVPISAMARVRPAPLAVQTLAQVWQHPKPGQRIVAPASISASATSLQALRPKKEQGEARVDVGVDTEPIGPAQRSGGWLAGGFTLNLGICLILAAWTARMFGGVTPAVNLLLAVWPSLLIGILLARLFRRVMLPTIPWAIFWGMFFGIVDVLLCAFICYGWTAFMLTLSHWGHDWLRAGDGLIIFRQVVAQLLTSVLSLILLSWWLAVPGGIVIGLFGLERKQE